jgi:hypothetical protein
MRVKMNEQPLPVTSGEEFCNQHSIHDDRLPGLGLHGFEPHCFDEPGDSSVGANANHARIDPDIPVVNEGPPEALTTIIPSDKDRGISREDGRDAFALGPKAAHGPEVPVRKGAPKFYVGCADLAERSLRGLRYFNMAARKQNARGEDKQPRKKHNGNEILAAHGCSRGMRNKHQKQRFLGLCGSID